MFRILLAICAIMTLAFALGGCKDAATTQDSAWKQNFSHPPVESAADRAANMTYQSDHFKKLHPDWKPSNGAPGAAAPGGAGAPGGTPASGTATP